MQTIGMLERFRTDVAKYRAYTFYSAKSALKSEVANSHLNWLWWVLNPLLFMMVYIFIGQVVFRSNTDNFPIFVFIGLTMWDFFNKTVLASVSLIKAKKSVVSKVYLLESCSFGTYFLADEESFCTLVKSSLAELPLTKSTLILT